MSDRVGLGAPPRPATPLVGRDEDAARVVAYLRNDHVRLLTLTGPGGVGKTRLALRVAVDLTLDFPDGVVFVPLANVAEAAMVLPAIAQAVDVRESGKHVGGGRLARALDDGRLLLVLDNFEHVVAAAAAVAELLADTSELKVLVTSRVPLRIGGEQEYAVPPLGVPASGPMSAADLASNPSVTLFVQRTRAVRAGFVLDDANAAAVADVCRRVDGLPLAIELAAARSKVLSPPALLARLTSGLGLLTGGGRDQPARLQTMRAAIAWSYDLLAEEARVRFRRLAVFVGGCTLDAAAAVGGASPGSATGVLDGVESLVDSSLLRLDEGPDGESRFGMLEMIREFGLEQLAASGEEDAVRARHAAWCLSLATEAEPFLYGGGDQVRWLDRIAAEHDNVRAALRWALDHDPETALRLAGAVYWFWYVRGLLGEGRQWLTSALDAAREAPDGPRARALLGAGMLAARQFDDVATRLLEESLALSRSIDDRFGAAMALGLIAIQAEDTGDYQRAMDFMEEAVSIGRGPGTFPRTLIDAGVTHLGIAAWGLGDIPRAEALLNEALSANRADGDDWGAANALGYLGLIACEQGRLGEAAPLLREGLRLYWEAGSLEDTAGCLANVATLAAAHGATERSARLFGAAETLRDAIDSRQGLPERAMFERAVSSVRADLGETTFLAAWAAGRALSAADAVAVALEADVELPPAAGDTPAATAGGLTAREVDVLRLLVTGATDREIGDALYISPRTAQAHVGHIFAKLGVSTRTAAVAAALRSDLVSDAGSSVQATTG